MDKPVLGRVVWFYPATRSHEEPPLAAMIVCVWSDTCVNLAIFQKDGNLMEDPPTSILLIQDDNPIPSGGHYCTWPRRGWVGFG